MDDGKQNVIQWQGELLQWNLPQHLVRVGWVPHGGINPSGTFPTDGLIGRWTFDNSLGNSGINSSPFQSRTGLTPIYTTGKIGQAVDTFARGYFNDDSSVVITAVNHDDFTFATWIQYHDPSTNSKVMWELGNTPFPQAAPYFRYTQTGLVVDGRILVTMLVNHNSYPNWVIDVSIDNGNDWHHYIFNFSKGIARFVVDNDIIYQAGWVHDSSGVQTDDIELALGYDVAEYHSGNNPQIVNEFVDNTYFYDRTLTLQEMADLYNDGLGI